MSNEPGHLTAEDLEIILLYRGGDIQRRLKKELKKHPEERFQMRIQHDSDESDEIYTIIRNCPVKSYLCEWQPEMMEGTNCGFYNGFKQKCVFPRTVAHNDASKYCLNWEDHFMGNIERYFEDTPEGKSADHQITARLQEMGLIPKEKNVNGRGISAVEWAYAEFEDDGKKIRLIEIGTDEDISKMLEAERKEMEDKANYARNQMQKELAGLRQRYSGNVRMDIDRIIELAKQLPE